LCDFHGQLGSIQGIRVLVSSEEHNEHEWTVSEESSPTSSLKIKNQHRNRGGGGTFTFWTKYKLEPSELIDKNLQVAGM